MIKQKIKSIKNCVEDKLRSLCCGLSPAGRVITIFSLLAFFGAMSMWMVVSSIFNIGRYSAPVQIDHISRPLILKPNDSIKIKFLQQQRYELKDSTNNNNE